MRVRFSDVDWLLAGLALCIGMLVALIVFSAYSTVAMQEDMKKAIQECVNTGGTPIVGHSQSGSNITSVYCAGAQR